MNKKLFFILTIIHLNIFCISAQIYPVRPQLSDKHSFSMILLPDPQSYNKFDANQPLFELQTAWIANSIEPLNIKGVLCTGDLVEQNEIRIPDGINGNQNPGTQTIVRPAKVTKLTVSSKKKKAFLKWKKNSKATGYEIYRATKKNGKYKKIRTIKKASAATFTDSKVKKGKTYYYKVRAYKTVKGNKANGKFSAVRKVKIKK